MKNPWTRKNPLLSMWLSGANAVAGHMRGAAAAAATQQRNATAKQVARAWRDMWPGVSRRGKRR